MIHAIRIKDGRLRYSNKYTMTDRLRHELERGEPVDIRIGELESGLSGLAKIAFFHMQKLIGY
jgi:carotenoid cleavage dioxygenase-like enzyme